MINDHKYVNCSLTYCFQHALKKPTFSAYNNIYRCFDLGQTSEQLKFSENHFPN